jgi:hypothetical protein
MKESVAILMTPKVTEALTFFIAERKALWERTAKDFGVDDPENLPRELILAHAHAVRREFKPRRVA